MTKHLNPRMLTDLAYEIALTQFHNQNFSFQNLWSLVWSQATDFKQEKVEDWIGDFYVDLCQDKRFLVCGPTTWCLKECITVEKAEKIANTMFLYEKDDLFEEGYEDYTDEIEVADSFEVDEEIQVSEDEIIDE
ncbi:DNA-directed RNA polymerase delta subunit [Mycoplasmoides fastidiosum]|uniref:RNAP delta factor n=1 Tax=Mycoplasmoides fastidiosum TaxID=92758 RepID=A0ABU0LXY5_9BACT|nr:DNA-directed RNA polymerase subunit delta [Mycoplasmoides fastidiosum]MDQ0513576.1 DNA-directed RNA polymerase delta subunit [Mycoplasmoides fastidiosum]UUD38002.1 DNA-directed RNA polymerase subunit delta [Mycoplasmoides fastidiosum]